MKDKDSPSAGGKQVPNRFWGCPNGLFWKDFDFPVFPGYLMDGYPESQRRSDRSEE